MLFGDLDEVVACLFVIAGFSFLVRPCLNIWLTVLSPNVANYVFNYKIIIIYTLSYLIVIELKVGFCFI